MNAVTHQEARAVAEVVRIREAKLCLAFYQAIRPHARCCMCRTTEAVEFHHVRPDEKTATITDIAARGTFVQLIQEFNKCIGLCAGHHDDVHMGRFPGWLAGKYRHGGRSHPLLALGFMPYLGWLAEVNEQRYLRLERQGRPTMVIDLKEPFVGPRLWVRPGQRSEQQNGPLVLITPRPNAVALDQKKRSRMGQFSLARL